MTLFEEYEQRKLNGEILDFESISRNKLKQLWFEENYTDHYIAKLFDVTPYKVNKRRREYALMWDNCIWDSCMEKPEFKEMLKNCVNQQNI